MATVKKQWFLIALILIFSLVIFDQSGTIARAGVFLKQNHGAPFMIFAIFILSGMIIEIEQIKAGIKDIKATSSTLWVIVIVSPIAAGIFALIPMETGIILGLFLVAVMPTTLSSGVVMTGQAGGNIAHALFITILSNCVAIVSIPFILPMLLNSLNLKTDLYIDQTAIFIKLLLLVLLPLLIGMILNKKILTISPEQKKQFSITNQCIVLCIVYMSLSGAREMLIAKGSAFFIILPLVVGFHLVLLLASSGTSHLAAIGRGRREAVIFMGSQKTLPLAVMLQITCFPEYGTALLVCVLHHITHLMIDGFIAVKIRP